MSGLTGKGATSIKKQEVKESRIPAIGFDKVRFLHKMVANATSISLTSLTAPSVSEAPQYSAPSVSQLTALNLAQYPNNITLRSSTRGTLIRNMAYDVAGASTITLLYPTDDGEIIEGVIDAQAVTGQTLVDAKPIVATGTLAAGDTDFNVGEPFEVGKYPLTQHGSVLFFVGSTLLRRNTNNSAPGAGVEGDYYEVHAGSGLGTILRVNTPDLVNDRDVSVVSVAALTERPNGSMMAFIESVNGKVDSMIPTLASLAEVDESTFGGVSNVDLKAFGDDVFNLKKLLNLNYTQRTVAYVRHTEATNVDAGGQTSGAGWVQRKLNVLENPDSMAITLTSNQIILPAGTYEMDAQVNAGVATENAASRLQNITTGTTILDGSDNENDAGVGGDSHIRGRFTLSATSTLEIQFRVQVTNTTTGWGQANNFAGSPEIYLMAEIRKLETKTFRQWLGL